MVEIAPEYTDGLLGIKPGDRLDVLYWMHKLDAAKRDLLQVHPRGDRSRPLKGVFGLRSPMRPNPIGVTIVEVLRIERNRVFVSGLDALDGAPVVDMKSARRQGGHTVS